MKKTISLIVSLLFLVSSSKTVLAQNKAGINIGDHFSEFSSAAKIVGPGGWVVIMACPGDADKIAQIAQQNPNINIIIRGHYPGQTPDAESNKLAKLWAASLASINFPKKVYFMPWNEPNHSDENGGPTAGDRAYNYTLAVKSEFQRYGILNTKVILLSAMVDKLNPSFIDGSFFTNPGGKSGFYSITSGSSINEYDQFSAGPCSSGIPEQNNCQYNRIGIPSPYYSEEAGVAGDGQKAKRLSKAGKET